MHASCLADALTEQLKLSVTLIRRSASSQAFVNAGNRLGIYSANQAGRRPDGQRCASMKWRWAIPQSCRRTRPLSTQDAHSAMPTQKIIPSSSTAQRMKTYKIIHPKHGPRFLHTLESRGPAAGLTPPNFSTPSRTYSYLTPADQRCVAIPRASASAAPHPPAAIARVARPCARQPGDLSGPGASRHRQ